MVVFIPSAISSILQMGLNKSNSSIKARPENYSNLKSGLLQPVRITDFVSPSFVDNQDEVTLMYSVTDPKILTRIVMDESGAVERLTWNDNKWVTFWSAPKECDTYGECGPNSYCDPYDPNKFRCTCLPGLEPRSTRDWSMRDGSGGCVRRQGVSTCRSGEGFVKLARVKVPDTSIARVDMSLSLEDCEQECLRNCSCMAYSSAHETRGGIGCLSWHGDLMDIRTFANGGQDLYIRVDAVVLGTLLYFVILETSSYVQLPSQIYDVISIFLLSAQYAKKNGVMQSKRMVAILVVCIGLMLLLVVSIAYWLVMRKKKGMQNVFHSFPLFHYGDFV
jgi:hypothetical protein